MLFVTEPSHGKSPDHGVCQHHDISVNGSSHHDAAWSYPDPFPSSFDRVGKDYTGYVAFDKKQITIAE